MTYNASEPSYQILISLIQIWDLKEGDDPMKVPDDCMMISEVENVEIEETYTRLINNATVQFPRGTVIRKTITRYNEDEAKKENVLQAGVNKQNGVVEVVRKSSSVATNDRFNVGQRIRIYLGYTTDPEVANYAKTSNLGKNIFNDSETRDKYIKAFDTPTQRAMKTMNLMFDGYITKVSLDTPIRLDCENLASVLREISCPDKEFKKCSVNTLLLPNEDGKKGNLDLLKDTGLTLHPKTKDLDIQIGHCKLTADKTLADLCEEWAKFGVYTFLSEHNGKPVLQCARSYFIFTEENDKDNDSILDAIAQPGGPIPIKFNYNVAKNNLSLAVIADGFIAIDAQGVSAEDKDGDQFLKITICKNPRYDSDPKNEKPYRILNESTISKKKMKKGFRPLSAAAKDKRNNLKLYTKIPYIAKKIPVTRDELLKEANKYMAGYNCNGIEGTLVLFGDLHLHTGYRVELRDDRYPQKNGIYIVESVETSFGTDGYRQTIKLPYCITRYGDENDNK